MFKKNDGVFCENLKVHLLNKQHQKILTTDSLKASNVEAISHLEKSIELDPSLGVEESRQSFANVAPTSDNTSNVAYITERSLDGDVLSFEVVVFE